MSNDVAWEEVIEKVANSEVSSGGNNLRDGSGRLALRKFEVTKGFNGLRAVFEFIVVSSKKKEGLVSLKTGQKLDIEPNLTGSDVSIINMLSKHESAWGNVKAVILGLFNEPDASKDDIKAAMRGMRDGVDGIGRVVDYDTYRKVTQEKGVEITLPKWYGVDQSDEDIARMREWIATVTGMRNPTAA